MTSFRGLIEAAAPARRARGVTRRQASGPAASGRPARPRPPLQRETGPSRCALAAPVDGYEPLHSQGGGHEGQSKANPSPPGTMTCEPDPIFM